MERKLTIDYRGLLNLMRHSYLFGVNAGLWMERSKTDEIDPNRDNDLAELIAEYKHSGYMDYNLDPGSHACTEECNQ